jgi:hypothetical protein
MKLLLGLVETVISLIQQVDGVAKQLSLVSVFLIRKRNHFFHFSSRN